MRAIETYRYMEFPLQQSERPKRMYSYWVTGKCPFPYDMLRYDAAWPAGNGSGLTSERYMTHDERIATYSVQLRSYREPTVDRWRSFGWSVSAHNERK